MAVYILISETTGRKIELATSLVYLLSLSEDKANSVHLQRYLHVIAHRQISTVDGNINCGVVEISQAGTL